MGIKVAKFGGSSLSDAEQFKKVKDILLSDPDRRYVVPSAPGRRFKDDDKITEKDLQKLTDDFTKEIDKIAEAKEKELTQI